jgi:hypothetical protein
MTINTHGATPGQRTPARGRDSIHVGASNTTKLAVDLPDSEVFSRSESFGFGRDGLVRKAGRTANFVFETSRPPVAHSNAASGSLSQLGAETMTKVNTPTTSSLDKIARQQAIENALSAALYFIRLPGTPSALHAATGRANRALSLLKQSCAEAKIGGAA